MVPTDLNALPNSKLSKPSNTLSFSLLSPFVTNHLKQLANPATNTQIQSCYIINSSQLKMALRRDKSPLSEQAHPDGLSKREQRKLQQILKHFPGQQEVKPRKKRKSIERQIRISPVGEGGKGVKEERLRGEEPEILVQTKQQSQLNLTPTRQPPAENSKSPLLPASPRNQQEQSQKKENHLNPAYPFREGETETTIMDFLAQCQYRQMERNYLKEETGFEGLEGGETLQVDKRQNCGLMKRVNGLIAEYKKCLDKRPFSKAHIALSVAISKKQN